jgi:uncharacterized membrane protein YfcA
LIEPLPVAFGLLVGFLVGLTGMGGGALMTPFLITIGMPAPTAIGTDMVYATVTKIVGSVQHYRQSSVNLEVAGFLALGSIPASLFGVQTLEWIKHTFDPARVDAIMITIIGCVLVLAGGSLIYRTLFMRVPERRGGWRGKGRMSLRRRGFTVLFGAFGGYLVGLTSVGSGSIMAIILLLLYPLAPAVVVGTDLAHATVLSLTTGAAHILYGNVDFAMAGMLLLGSVPGVVLGSVAASRVPGTPLKIVLAGMITFIGLRMLIG